MDITTEQVAEVVAFLHDLDDRLANLDYTTRSGVLTVLSALRGPDEAGRSSQKYSTTNFIREAALPKAFGEGGAGNWDITQRDFVPPPDNNDHFDQHVRHAAKALGLIPPPPPPEDDYL